MGELEEKIKKELLKSGFPLQIYCRRCLTENDWDILSASEYYISASTIKKEIDVIGYSGVTLNEKTYIQYELFIECKKNEDNPWIFFKNDSATRNDVLLSYKCAAPNKWPIDLSNVKNLHFPKTASSSIYTLAFKLKEKGNQIYEAISSVILAHRLRWEFLDEIWNDEKVEEIEFSTISVDFLTILFDGRLYLAELKEDGTPELTETNNLVYCHKETKPGKSYCYNIDIVNRDYFPSYLKILNKDKKAISGFYQGLI